MFAIVRDDGMQENILVYVFISLTLFLMLLGQSLRSQCQITDIRAEVGRLREEVERLERGQHGASPTARPLPRDSPRRASGSRGGRGGGAWEGSETDLAPWHQRLYDGTPDPVSPIQWSCTELQL